MSLFYHYIYFRRIIVMFFTTLLAPSLLSYNRVFGLLILKSFICAYTLIYSSLTNQLSSYHNFNIVALPLEYLSHSLKFLSHPLIVSM